jgi:hypothetical protein
MLWTDIQDNVKLRLGQLPASDPHISQLTLYCNEGQDFLVRRAKQHSDITRKFPELKKRWTITTVAGQESYSLPADLFILFDAYSLDSLTATMPAPGTGAVRMELTESDEEYYEDDRMGVGYPREYYKYDDEVGVLPIPAAGYETNILITGLCKPEACPPAPGASAPSLAERWHMAIADATVYLISDHKGWMETAAVALSQLDRRLIQQIHEDSEHKKRNPSRISFRGQRR